MAEEYLALTLAVPTDQADVRYTRTIQFHPAVVAALQFTHGHPRATLLYLWLLTAPAFWTEGFCQVYFASEGAFQAALEPGLGWHRIHPLLRLCVEEFRLTEQQHHEVVAQHALTKSWSEIVQRTYPKLQCRLQRQGFSRDEETALNHLFAYPSLQWKVRRALDPLVAQLPWLAFGRKSQMLSQWIRQLQDWEVVETELDWLQEAGLVLREYRAQMLTYTLAPHLAPEQWHPRRTAKSKVEETAHPVGEEAHG